MSEHHEAHFNAYQGLSCYFCATAIAALAIGATGVALATNGYENCTKASEYLLFGATCTLIDGAFSLLLGCAINRLMEGSWSACWMLSCLSIYGAIIMTKFILLCLDTAMVFGSDSTTCNDISFQRYYVIAQLALFGFEIFIGFGYAMRLGLEDAVEEALYHMGFRDISEGVPKKKDTLLV
mmetsp:Transcript_12626/g.21007  ORF Transcript_12626/g.21007 Transcript_12626/m.21007 type:complete len:181 (+) Transcript_12626:2766-3308(+)